MIDKIVHVTETAEAIASVATDAIEHAQEQVVAAQETAEQIALAAIEGERNNRIAQFEQGLSECRTQIAELPSRMETLLTERLTQMTEALASVNADALASFRAELEAEITTRLTPPILEAQPIVEVTEPENLPPVPAEPIASEPTRKKRRFV